MESNADPLERIGIRHNGTCFIVEWEHISTHLEELVDLLHATPQVKTLSLMSPWSIAGMERLPRAMAKLPRTVDEITLCINNVDRQLTHVLSNVRCDLKSIGVNCGPISNEDSQGLLELFENNPGLEALRLTDVKFHSSEFMTGVIRLKCLHTLHLDGHWCADDDRFLMSTVSSLDLHHLVLRNSQPSPGASEVLATWLTLDPLETLSLHTASPSSDDCGTLAVYLERSKRLRELDTNWWNPQIASGIERNRSLLVLSISKVDMSESHLRNVLKKNHGIVDVQLDCSFPKQFREIAYQYTTRNRAMKQVAEAEWHPLMHRPDILPFSAFEALETIWLVYSFADTHIACLSTEVLWCIVGHAMASPAWWDMDEHF